MQEKFAEYDRDYFSLEGYQALLDMFEETGTDTALDVIAICCEFSEEEPSYIIEEYSNIDTIAECKDGEEIDTDKLLDALNYYTYAVKLSNGSILYQNF